MSKESGIFKYLREQEDESKKDNSTLNEEQEEDSENVDESEDEQEDGEDIEGFDSIDEDCTIAVCPECSSVVMINEGEDVGFCSNCGTALDEKVKLVVRHGKVLRKILKRKKKKILTSKQKSALKKARQKAHTSSAKASRKKSMKKARTLKHESLKLDDSTKQDLKETLAILEVPSDVSEAFDNGDYAKVEEYLNTKYNIVLNLGE